MFGLCLEKLPVCLGKAGENIQAYAVTIATCAQGDGGCVPHRCPLCPPREQERSR